MLEHLLEMLDKQVTKDLFRFSIVVVDNDADESARSVVEACRRRLRVAIAYRVETRQNIALARNTSVAGATGDLVAFIDDDEEPVGDWLFKLYESLLVFQADGVLGPVLPKFEKSAPRWAVRGRVFQRPGFQTGAVIPWHITGMGNVLVKQGVLLESPGPFNSQLGAGGEDTDFFRRAMSRGRIFVWSADAICYEYVSPERTSITFQLRRALLRGKVASRTTAKSLPAIMKSALAVVLYTVALPVLLLGGSHIFVTYLVKSFDHLGKLLAICGIDLVGEKYIIS
jgi:succinoglycan biosynthesis protein ExoM